MWTWLRQQEAGLIHQTAVGVFYLSIRPQLACFIYVKQLNILHNVLRTLTPQKLQILKSLLYLLAHCTLELILVIAVLYYSYSNHNHVLIITCIHHAAAAQQPISKLHGFRDNDVLLPTWHDVIGSEIFGVFEENDPQKVKISKNICLKGTFLIQSVSFELLCVKIGSRV